MHTTFVHTNIRQQSGSQTMAVTDGDILHHQKIGRVTGTKASDNVIQYLGIKYATLKDAFSRGQAITYPQGGADLNAKEHGYWTALVSNFVWQESLIIRPLGPWS